MRVQENSRRCRTGAAVLSRFVVCAFTVGFPVKGFAESVKGTYSYASGTGTLKVDVKASSQTWNKLRIRCKDADELHDFTVVTSGFTKNGIISESGQTFLKLDRTTGGGASDDSVTLTHTGAKRGGDGAVKVFDGGGEVFGAVTASLVAVGACDLPGSSTNCICDISQEACVAYGGNYLGDNSACPGDCVPTISDWGLVVMGLLVASAATVVIMRRRAMTAA
jgi:hypothetical protein